MTSADIPAKRMIVGDLARHLAVNEGTVYDYIKRLNLRPDKKKRYATLSVFQEHERRQHADGRRSVPDGEMPPIRTWSDVEKRSRNEKLRIEIQLLRGDLVPIEEVTATLGELCAAFRHALENWVQMIASEATDAEQVRSAERLRDQTLKAAQERIEG